VTKHALAEYLSVFAETKSAARTARILGCSKPAVYRALHRAGMSVRPYRRRVLRLVGPPLAEWQALRQGEIDADLARLRAERGRLHRQLAQLKGWT
jgi:hypothetical protein